MDFYRDIPEYVQKAIETEGISQEQIRAIAHADLDHQGNFLAAWHCVDDRSIYIFAQTKQSGPAQSGAFCPQAGEGAVLCGN